MPYFGTMKAARRTNTVRCPRASSLRTLVGALALIGAIASTHADESGFSGGHSLAAGTPALIVENGAERALEPGSVALSEEGARLNGDRTFAGYRFGPAFALEGAQTRFGTAPGSSGETLSVAGLSSVNLSDSITLSAKLGVHYPHSALTGGEGSLSLSNLTTAGRLYGLGLSYQVAENVELRAQSDRYLPSSGSEPGVPTVNTVLVGANLRF
jgi:hypothetical protein